jgi:hypothetical protein
MIRRLSLHLHLENKKLEADKGVEDHVKFLAVTLNTALELVRRKGESALLERRGEAKFSSSPLRHNIDLRNRGGLLSQV